MRFTFRKITIEGLTLRIGQIGAKAPDSAVPLLLLNGIGFNAELMEPLARQFPGRPILCPDMPGCGQSPDPVLPYTMPRLARAMDALMQREYPDRSYDCLGFSWGGALAQQVAVQAPRRVARLALMATPSGMPLPITNAEVMRRLFDPTEYVDPRALTGNFLALLHEGGAGAGLLRRFTSPTPAGVGCQVATLLGWSVAPMLPFLRMPVLLAGMMEDAIVPIAHQRALRCLIPQAETEELRTGSHLLPLSLPDRVSDRLRTFLSPESAFARA